jgi:hypothetical protein
MAHIHPVDFVSMVEFIKPLRNEKTVTLPDITLLRQINLAFWIEMAVFIIIMILIAIVVGKLWVGAMVMWLFLELFLESGLN